MTELLKVFCWQVPKNDARNSWSNYMQSIDKKETELCELRELISSIKETPEEPLDTEALLATYRTHKDEYNELFDISTENLDSIIKLSIKFKSANDELSTKIDSLNSDLQKNDSCKLNENNLEPIIK